MRIGSVVIKYNNFEAMFRFWQAALRYVPREPPRRCRLRCRLTRRVARCVLA